MNHQQLKAYAEALGTSKEVALKYTRPDGTKVIATLAVVISPPVPALPTLLEAPTEFKAEKLDRDGINQHYFKAVSPIKITRFTCEAAQIELGYNPQGYGISVPVIQQYTNGWTAIWYCFGSCE